MGAQIKEDYISVADFWIIEEKSEVRHEYLNGRIYAMPGGTPNIAVTLQAQISSERDLCHFPF